MVKIYFTYESKKFKHFLAEGHSLFAKKGQDIVCAGVSACIVGAFNAIEETKNFQFTLGDGRAELKALSEVNVHDAIVIETLLTQLKTIAVSYKDYVQVTTEERS